MMWSRGHVGERNRRGKGYSNGQEERELRIRMQNEDRWAPWTKGVGRRIKEAIHVHTEDSDLCVPRKRSLTWGHTDTVFPIKEIDT